MKILVSGLFSGLNPSPGLGVARSLRVAYPTLKLIGVDYSTRSTGLHSEVFDELWIQRPWSEIDLERYRSSILERLESGGLWLSGLDLETAWLADAVGPHACLLGPTRTALQAVAKPAARLAAQLGLAHPPTISGLESDWELHRFCREHGWRVWVKGPQYQAVAIRGWQEFLRARADLLRTWGTEELHLQAHVPGVEESLVFAAWRGSIEAIGHMVKRIITPEGKTWAGTIRDPEVAVPHVAERLSEVFCDIGWSGGGELEMLRDPGGELYLLECNPRFPAWVYGMTLAGLNLPGALVAAATGKSQMPSRPSAAEFVRVVVEIPARSAYPLPAPLIATDGAASGGKHPSGMPDLAHLLVGDDQPSRRSPPGLDAVAQRELTVLMQNPPTSPSPLLLPDSTADRWQRMTDALSAITPIDGMALRIAYSIKTNPDPRILALAAAQGFLAEAISADEFAFARNMGFASEEIVLNGPAKSWPVQLQRECPLAAFADSETELRHLVRAGVSARYLGLRLRPPTIQSRFGIQVGDFATFAATTATLRAMSAEVALGVHFHYPSSDLGWNRWYEAARAMLEWATALQVCCGRPVRCLDLGGGWDPADWTEVLIPILKRILVSAREQLRDLELVILEPGKALVQPAFVVVTQVLEVREGREAVVDASIAELPEAASYPHRVLRRCPETGLWEPLRTGSGRILGRLCMEADVLSTGLALDDLRAGEHLVIGDSGAYDRSMAFAFGRG